MRRSQRSARVVGFPLLVPQRYEPLSSKYSGYCLLVEFFSKLRFRYLLLVGSSSVLVTVALV